MQARLSATGKGAPTSSAAGGGAAAAALAASLSAFSATSASRTSLVAAPKSGFCSRSLASSGLKPRSGSATRSPRTASRRRASGVQGSHMRGAPPRGKGSRRARSLLSRSRPWSHGLAKFEREDGTIDALAGRSARVRLTHELRKPKPQSARLFRQQARRGREIVPRDSPIGENSRALKSNTKQNSPAPEVKGGRRAPDSSQHWRSSAAAPRSRPVPATPTAAALATRAGHRAASCPVRAACACA
eukprot:scaffold56739_cov66-Phaeocystis_antarctica.AAC.5